MSDDFERELREAHRLFRESLAARADSLVALYERAAAGEAEDVAALKLALHRLAGTAGTYEHDALFAAARGLEQRLAAGEPVLALEPELRRLVAMMRAAARQGS